MYNSMVVFFFCKSEIPFLGQFGTKIQNCPFKLELGTKSISNMSNSLVMFTFSVLHLILQVLSKKSIWHFDVTLRD